MEPLYRLILSQAWTIVKKTKWLWLFGLFAAFLGNGGEIDMLFQYSKLTNAPTYLNSLRDAFANLDLNTIKNGVLNALATKPLFSILYVSIITVFILLFLWLVTVSQGGIIHATATLDAGKKINFREALLKGIQKFWSILGLNFAVNFLLYFSLIILAIPFAAMYMANNSVGALSFITILAFIILIPLTIIFSFVLKYAFAFVIIKNQPIINAFGLAWKLFLQNWLISLEMAFLLFFINLLVSFILVILIVLLAVPFIGIGLLMVLIQNEVGIMVALSFSFIILLALILFTGAGLATFQYSAWTILFQKLHTGKKYPKLIRLVAGSGKKNNK
jgi:hypothetical protein